MSATAINRGDNQVRFPRDQRAAGNRLSTAATCLNKDYVFRDRYQGEADYLVPGPKDVPKERR